MAHRKVQAVCVRQKKRRRGRTLYADHVTTIGQGRSCAVLTEGMDSILLFFIRQDKADYQDNFFVFINFRKKLMKHNPPSIESKTSDYQYPFI